MIRAKKVVSICIATALVLGSVSLLASNGRLHDVLMQLSPVSVFLSAVLYLVGGNRSDLTNYDDYNSLLNEEIDQHIFPHLGSYGVRRSIASQSPFPPAGCRVEVVNSLERHGARLMTSKALKSANVTLKKIQRALADVAVESLPSELQFLKSATLLAGTSSLVPYGALQAYYSGKSTAATYALLRHLPPFVRAGGDEETQNDRVILNDRIILTAKYWRLGFEGARFPSGLLKTAEDVRKAASDLSQPDVIISERKGSNNTLDVTTCPNFNNIPSDDGELGAQAAFTTSTIVPVVGARLDSRFANAGVRGLKLKGQDLLNIAMLCSFETLGRASVSNGKLSLKQSDFCNVLNADEWPIVGYAFDVGKWKGQGYGNTYFKALGTGFLRELVARFNGTAPLLIDPTSLNSTIDGQQETFPLPHSTAGPVVYFDGSHDNNIAPIAASLGLFNGPNETTARNAQKLPHNWIFSQISPFQGKIVFEKLSCGLPASLNRQRYIRIRANGAVLTGWCGEDHNMLCPMSTFLDKLAFVQNTTEWNTCFTALSS